jgi:hypothetical protein
MVPTLSSDNAQTLRTSKQTKKYPSPSENVIKRWQARHPGFQYLAPGTMRAHSRFLFLLDVAPPLRWTTFERLTNHCTDATRATYWGGVLSLIKEMGEVVLDGEKKAMAWLDKQANLRVGVHTPTPMNETQAKSLYDRLDDPVTLALAIAWTLGQRPSDVLQLETKGVHENPTGGGDTRIHPRQSDLGDWPLRSTSPGRTGGQNDPNLVSHTPASPIPVLRREHAARAGGTHASSGDDLGRRRPLTRGPLSEEGRAPTNGIIRDVVPRHSEVLETHQRSVLEPIPQQRHLCDGPSERHEEQAFDDIAALSLIERSAEEYARQRRHSIHEGNFPASFMTPSSSFIIPPFGSKLCTAEDMGMPLHIKEVSPLNWTTLDRYVATHGTASEYEVWSRLTAFYRGNVLPISPVPTAEAKLTQEDIVALGNAGRIREVSRNEVRGWAHSFSVPEREKCRRR